MDGEEPRADGEEARAGNDEVRAAGDEIQAAGVVNSSALGEVNSGDEVSTVCRPQNKCRWSKINLEGVRPRLMSCCCGLNSRRGRRPILHEIRHWSSFFPNSHGGRGGIRVEPEGSAATGIAQLLRARLGTTNHVGNPAFSLRRKPPPPREA
jgi:hypothetical protein